MSEQKSDKAAEPDALEPDVVERLKGKVRRANCREGIGTLTGLRDEERRRILLS
jgi:hypothetical protein